MSDFKADKVMSYGEFQGTAEVSLEDNCLFGRVLHIDDVITYEANSPQELRKAFEEAVDDYLDFCKTQGTSPNKPYKGVFNVRVGPPLHKQAALSAKKRAITLNEFVKEAISEKVKGDDKGSQVVFQKHEFHFHNEEIEIYDVSNDAEGGSQWLKSLGQSKLGSLQ
jgi:predicted HicB family RNase H-like nuclease